MKLVSQQQDLRQLFPRREERLAIDGLQPLFFADLGRIRGGLTLDKLDRQRQFVGLGRPAQGAVVELKNALGRIGE